jgi:hypothetical protein
MRSPLLRAIAPLVVAWTVGACGGTPTPAQPPADAPPVVGARPLPPAAALGSSEPPIPSSCAGRALLRADLEARGAGPRHPDLLRLEAAERPCDADRARTVEACVEVHRRVGELEASGLGPAHPTRVRLGAQLKPALLNDSTTHAELLLVTYLDARAEGRVLIDDHRVLIAV